MCGDRRGVTQESKDELLLEVITKRMVRWFGRGLRAKCTLTSTILQGKVEGGKYHEEGEQDSGWMM